MIFPADHADDHGWLLFIRVYLCHPRNSSVIRWLRLRRTSHPQQ